MLVLSRGTKAGLGLHCQDFVNAFLGIVFEKKWARVLGLLLSPLRGKSVCSACFFLGFDLLSLDASEDSDVGLALCVALLSSPSLSKKELPSQSFAKDALA